MKWQNIDSYFKVIFNIKFCVILTRTLNVPEGSSPDCVSGCDVTIVERSADRDVPLVGQRDGGEDGPAEGDVVQGVDDERKGVNKHLARPFEGPERKKESRN